MSPNTREVKMNYYDTRRQEARRIRNMSREEAFRSSHKMGWDVAGAILYPALRPKITSKNIVCGDILTSKDIPGFVDVMLFHEHGFYKVRVWGKDHQKQTLSFKRFKDARKHFNREKIKRIEEWEPKPEIDVFGIL